MSEEAISLMPVARGELATATGANPLVARGLATVADARLTRGKEVSQPVFDQGLICFNRGVEWLKKEDTQQRVIAFAEAIRLFDMVIRLDPDNAFAHFFRGKAAVWVETDSAAIRQQNLLDRIRKARANVLGAVPPVESSKVPVSHPANSFHPEYTADAYTFCGKFWLDRQDHDKAGKSFDQAIQFDAKNSIRYYTHGNYWLDRSEYEEAIWNLTQAITLAPQASHYYQARSFANLGKKDIEKAAADYEQALYLHADHAFAIRWIALLAETCSEERIRDAKRAIQDALHARQPNNWKNGWELNALAEAYADAGLFDQAQWYQAAALETPVGRGWIEAQFRRRLENYQQGMRWRDNPRY